MILQKYFAALLSITIVVLTALLAIPSGQINGPAIVQLVAVGIAAIVTYLSPLVNIKWKGILKTGAAMIAAVISVLYPLLITHGAVTPIEIAMMVLAALNALGVEVGVQIRTDQSTLMPVDKTPTDTVNVQFSETDREILAEALQPAPSMSVGGPVSPPTAPVAQPEVVAPAVAYEPVQQAPVADEPVYPVEEAPEPGIPELVPVITAPNPANAVDDTTSVNLANLTE